MTIDNTSCILCGGNSILVKVYYSGLKDENLFGLKDKKYRRIIYNCKDCDHYFNHHKYKFFLEKVYNKNYSKFSYGKINKRFNKIYNLPKKKSANQYRINYLLNFIKKKKIKPRKILDFGAGTGVFPFSLKQKGYDVEFIEKDLLSYNYLKKKLGLKPLCKNILKLKKIKRKYDIITCNKVLEHFPKEKLNKTINKLKKLLNKNGIIYLELPDAENAKKEGFERQEFFFEHFHIFTKKSVETFLLRKNLKILKTDLIYEVNKKYTIRVIAQK